MSLLTGDFEVDLNEVESITLTILSKDGVTVERSYTTDEFIDLFTSALRRELDKL